VPRVNKNGFSCVQAFHNAAEFQSLWANHKCTELQDPFHQRHDLEYYSEDRALQSKFHRDRFLINHYQTARAAEGISTISGSLESSNWCIS
jgi:hypothetical protein